MENSNRFLIIADLRNDENSCFNRVISYEEANQYINESGCTYLEVNSLTGFNMDMISQYII
jgi:hypothetical protein